VGFEDGGVLPEVGKGRKRKRRIIYTVWRLARSRRLGGSKLLLAYNACRREVRVGHREKESRGARRSSGVSVRCPSNRMPKLLTFGWTLAAARFLPPSTPTSLLIYKCIIYVAQTL
jgi:hypothetical protein